MVPKLLELDSQVKSIKFDNGTMSLYDESGNIIQESNYQVVSEDSKNVRN